MGEKFTVKEMPPIDVLLNGTDTIVGLEIFMDGDLKSSVIDLLQSNGHLHWIVPADKSLVGQHSFFVRVKQADGNMAWSSPMWINIKP